MDWKNISKITDEMLKNGESLPTIAKKLNINYSTLLFKYKPVKKNFKYFNHFGHKKESYYSNEWEYASTPTYKFHDLSKSEIDFYFDTLKFSN